MSTGTFSLYPRYGKDQKVLGWQGRAELRLEGRDFGRITGMAGKIQSMAVSDVSFGLSREARAKAEGEAQSQAIEQFKARAAELSKAFGFASYDLRSLLRGGASDAAIAAAIAPIWQQRTDRYSELRSTLPADNTQGARRVEMSYIGG